MQSVTPAIPASQIVSVIPSVLSAGGNALDLNGMMLTASNRLPAGQVLRFPDANSVASYFGPTSQEAALAAVYFNGFDTSTVKPGALFFSQYAWQQPTSAWLRGGNVSALTLAQLQALSGTLSVVIDGVAASATINLAAATSFSNAAQLIEAALNVHGPTLGSYTGSIAGNTATVSAISNGPQTASVVGSIAGNVLSVGTLNWGTLAVGNLITGSGVTPGTTITALGSALCGGVGTYTVNNAQTIALESLQAYNPTGGLATGQKLSGTGVTANTFITALGTGGGGIGTYSVTPSQTAASQALTAYGPAVYYDAISGGFVINSGTAGAASTLAYATGTLAAGLALTQATGATLSQGTAQSTPAAAMNAIIAQTQDWAQFMTLFEPCDPDKTAFAQWTNGTGNRYGYALWDTSVVDTQGGGPEPAVKAIVLAGYSGVSPIYQNPAVDNTGQVAAFVLGYGAAINFTETQGRATAAFKAQSGLPAHVFDATTAQNLLNAGMNFYGDYTTANEAFLFYYNGSVTGKFRWLDTFLNQIWLNNGLQVSLMQLLTNAKSIPYNQSGYGLIQAACLDIIQQAVNNGVIQPGVPLSPSQAAQVNNAAGKKVDDVIVANGWYLQVKAAPVQVRLNRGSPPITLFYTDGESVQQINLASIVIQ